MRKAMFLVLALSAAATAFSAAPRLANAAEDCYWYCECETVVCSCGYYRLCPWPPPPIQCPTCP